MLVKWHPAATIFSDVEKAFLRNWFTESDTAVAFAPDVDVLENKDGFVLRAELPGLKKDDLKITLDNGVLTLAGEKRYETEKDEKNYHLRETRQGKFERRFRLGEGIDRSSIKADYKDGVLTLSLPKSREALSREIAITVN
jgi:HSP20 family protein